jgi:glycine/D-amino acid oxidase-like deaminating enzyme
MAAIPEPPVDLLTRIDLRLCNKSVLEALIHGGIANDVGVDVMWVSSESFTGAKRAAEVLAATNGYTPAALPTLRRRVIPIGSYQIATAPLGSELARRLVPKRRVFSDTKHLLYYFRLSPDDRMVFGGRASFTPTGLRRSAAILRAGMREVFPELGDAVIEFAWAGKVAYPVDHLPHAGRLGGLYYAMGYCGHGVALATYLGGRMGDVIAGKSTLPDLGAASFRPIPLYNGVPWFLPLVGGYYRIRDWLS